jgi:S1-C subfamily serine protease
MQVIPGGVAASAGMEAGDLILSLGEVAMTVTPGVDPFEKFRTTYATREGQALPIRVRRGDQEVTLPATVQLRVVTTTKIVVDPAASPRAQKVRHGLFAGVTE